MSRANFRQSFAASGGGRTPLAGRPGTASNHLHRHGLNPNNTLSDENRRSLSVVPPADSSSDASVKLQRIPIGSAKVVPNGRIDDLLCSLEGGSNDYDWLITPPGTPLSPSMDARSTSATKASRLSVSTRPARSSSSSTPAAHFGTCLSNRSSPCSVLNTSSASMSSSHTTRPSSPMIRSPSLGRSSISRPSSTPSRPRPPPNVKSTLPSSRPQIPSKSSSPAAARSSSRSSTPTRPTPVPSVGRGFPNGRTPGPSSRPGSPSQRVRTPQKPVVIPPGFSLDTPPNLRTTLPADRPISAGRSRPSATIITGKGNSDRNVPQRRSSSPVVIRGRALEPSGRGHIHPNGHVVDNRSDSGVRRLLKSSSTTAESAGFGRTISKKSLDMAIRHMDIRNGAGGSRPTPGTTLFPHSNRGGSMKTSNQTVCSLTASVTTAAVNDDNGHLHQANEGRQLAKLGEGKIYESTRYDAMLLKEDVKSLDWLHSIDDDFDQASIFDHRFEPPPEPFAPL